MTLGGVSSLATYLRVATDYSVEVISDVETGVCAVPRIRHKC